MARWRACGSRRQWQSPSQKAAGLGAHFAEGLWRAGPRLRPCERPRALSRRVPRKGDGRNRGGRSRTSPGRVRPMRERRCRPRGRCLCSHGRRQSHDRARRRANLIARFSPQPRCDDCIAERLGLSVRQHADQKTREDAGEDGWAQLKRLHSGPRQQARDAPPLTPSRDVSMRQLGIGLSCTKPQRRSSR